MTLVLTARFNNGFEAAVAQSRLTDEGIESFIFDMEMNWGGLNGMVPVRLMVLDDDVEDALRILNQPADSGGDAS